MNLNQITIPSINIEESVAFYKTLGLHLIVDVIPNYARFECPDGESTFSIHKVDSVTKNSGVTIYFEDDNLDALVEKLKKKGVKFDSLPEDKFWLWREAHLQDPDGNNIILYHAGENRKNPPWRIN
ncbi:glyoxalase/bleomycin resistance/extradiol dioxygenase family protein [Algibacter marinivivus]|uniref:Glyoxalase/bleomycin resistance/extradiol dioxygenase family protein n=1 Tax=Algibacter marinivivus TaxID=2100723 RepID=A0A2U2X5L2_9FLAO|nr:VOC family protein [Algibacter marinivivus]PWH83063.1 glyoxalase/bleomycin resistance/extradiol dioxygenase family protein [Algibacter marinivivus]